MDTDTDDCAAQREAEETATRRAAERKAARRAKLAPHVRQHIERHEREQEARRVREEYGRAQREAKRASEEQKTCNACNQSLPLSAFEVKDKAKGTLRGTCGVCRKAATAAQRRAARAALRTAPERQVEPEAPRTPPIRFGVTNCRSSSAKRQWTRRSPEDRQREAEEVAHFVALLMGTHPTERITSAQQEEATANKLHRLWLRSGPKECVSCKETVPPTAIHAPGPANFHPGKCHRCAHEQHRQSYIRVTGIDPDTIGPRLILMRDGTSITVAEFARRVRDRGQGRRVHRLGA